MAFTLLIIVLRWEGDLKKKEGNECYLNRFGGADAYEKLQLKEKGSSEYEWRKNTENF